MPPPWRTAFLWFAPVVNLGLPVLASVANRAVKPTRLRRAAYFRSLEFQMIKEEISFRCPLCNQKFFAKGIHRHLKKNHPKISKVEFILLLRKAENSGIKVVEKKRITFPDDSSPYKTVFTSGVFNESKVTRVVLGGAIGLGKK